MCTPQTLTHRYLDVLHNHLGLEADAPDDLEGSVVLQHAGLTHVLVNHAPHDPEYVELTVLLSYADQYDLTIRSTVAARLTRRYKTLTASATEDGVLLSFDSVVASPKTVPSPGILVAVLPRLLHQASIVCDALHTELQFHALTSPPTAPVTAAETAEPKRD